MEHFIPLRRTDLIELCAADLDSMTSPGGPTTGDGVLNRGIEFRQFSRMLSALFHFEGHERLELLKNAYAPVNPDRDTVQVRQWSADELASLGRQFASTLTEIILAANFTAITARDLADALNEHSLFKVRLAVDFDAFEEVLFYRRGESIREEVVKIWGGLSSRVIRFTNYDRVVVFVRFRDREEVIDDSPKHVDNPGRGIPGWTRGAVMLKLFQNVPKADLEMLFPNTEVRMRTIDKFLIGVPALVSGMVIATTKLGATVILIAALAAFWLGLSKQPVILDQASLLALGGGLGALSGYIWKQFSSFKNRKIRFMKALADNLYFKNLDNNVGVFHRLIDAAEEEECKEALLAYFFLLSRGSQSAPDIDAGIEAWLLEKVPYPVDFEVDDALRKLLRLGLISRSGAPDQTTALFSAVSLADAKMILDRIWDGLFDVDAERANPA